MTLSASIKCMTNSNNNNKSINLSYKLLGT